MEIKDTQRDDALVLQLIGRLDAATSEDAQKQVLNWIDQGQTRLAVDLSELRYISSAGLRVLLMAHKKLRQTGGALALFGVRDYIREIFDIAGFTVLFTIAASEEDALDELKA